MNKDDLKLANAELEKNKFYYNVLVNEYNSLRNEINQNHDRELQLFIIIISALGIIYSIIFSQGIFDLLFFIPILTYPLFLRARYVNQGTIVIGEYLLNIERQIKKIIDSNNKKGWSGWQHYWIENIKLNNLTEKPKKNSRKTLVKSLDMSSKLFLFIFIPIGLSILYSAFILIMNFTDFFNSFLLIDKDISKYTILNPYFHFVVIFFYLYFFLKSLYYYKKKPPVGLEYLVNLSDFKKE